MVVKDPFRKINISMKRFKAVPWRRQSHTTKWSRPPTKWATRKFRPILWAMGGLLTMALLLPVLVVSLIQHPTPPTSPTEGAIPTVPTEIAEAEEQQPQPQVSVYLSKIRQIETLPLDDYVTGVVAAEMPADFAFESLKAQAIAARTYIVQRLLMGDTSGVPVQGADVTDTVSHQAYISKERLESEWNEQGRATQLANLRRAVEESRNIIMTYKGKPITATFFSTSNGYTENSEDYWKEAIPYLRSVSSPWDIKLAPHYKDAVKLSKKEFLREMGLSEMSVVTLKNDQGTISFDSLIHILSTTQGKRIKELNIGGVTFSGREVRERLSLRSSQFSWVDSGDDIIITTYGNGHGVGMSQWGANGMAQEGYTATQILRHYYTGIEFQQVSKLLSKK
jgi:stage II sporulation protein D